MRLLAAVDFGLTHESVVATAQALAPALGLEAQLVHVIPDPYSQGLAHRFPDLAPPPPRSPGPGGGPGAGGLGGHGAEGAGP